MYIGMSNPALAPPRVLHGWVVRRMKFRVLVPSMYSPLRRSSYPGFHRRQIGVVRDESVEAILCWRQREGKNPVVREASDRSVKLLIAVGSHSHLRSADGYLVARERQ